MILDRRFDWLGRQIAWTRRGSGPPLVFCHGTPWSSRLWAPFAAALADEFTVYLWDMPGYGASSKRADHDVDLSVQGAAFTALLEHCDLDRPHVVAHDYGGAVSLRTHLLDDVAYASLCLVDVVALRPWGSPFFTLVKDNANVFAQLPAAVHRGALEAYISGASHRGLRPEDLAMLTAPWCDDEGQAAFYRQIAQADERLTAELEPLLPGLTTPTHIIWGENDTWIPADRAHRLHEAIPTSTLALVAEAGHLIQLDQPVALATQLRHWLTHATRA
ncbi:alpha/beta fold hydrolase [Jatrophihabitans endophyticus]|uniref:alpha/beta fold hydrolase n=1 Tax=Jatrophihabitans endophyticus TaxID=1206085 RepID=UPI000932803F|nr:alpha/beta fold hydrolase [Jatrophihabitans endophyticus]